MSEEAVGLRSPEQVAARLGVTRQHVWRLIRSGELKAVRIGHLLRVDPAELENFIAERGARR
jgi:excisionase family DNA binding protein